ncbi:MAG: L-sorbose 1-phosphate reductase [Bacteroides sp. SM23_62_1]|nr:MAG: L-sorbose 1-phosphate reductase [Bacteroides sp. SM23_62_1]
MKTKAVRIYGKNDLRLEEFELPPLKDDEILARVVSDTICMSSYKATKQGADHRRVPDNVSVNPTIIGHEFAGELIQIGKKWQHLFNAGEKFSIQPALNYKGSMDAPGYSFPYIGGDATYIIIPNEVMEMNCLLPYYGRDFFMASLSEPLSCIIGAFHASYHTSYGSYVHQMDIREGGNMAILAGVGPMGLGAIDYAIHRDRKPGLLVVTDIDDHRLERAARMHTPEEAQKNGVRLLYVNTRHYSDPVSYLKGLTAGKGFDDVFVFAPVRQVVVQADQILGFDGCLNFFAGPEDKDFSAELNFYNVHYAFTHIVGTTGGNTDDMKEALDLMGRGVINPAVMVTHIGGLDAVIDTTKRLPEIPGGKKLIYTNISLELTAIEDFRQKGEKNTFFKDLADIVKINNGIWCGEAEDYLLKNGKPI